MRAINVVGYDPSWPRLFAEISTEVAALLGSFVLSIDHIGSTSVPGLAAKPKIDLDVVAISDDVLPAAIDSISAAPLTAPIGSGSCFAIISGITPKGPQPMPS